MRRKRTEITVETHEVLIVRQSGGHQSVWCDTCSESVQGWTPEVAANLIGVHARLIYRGGEAGNLHFIENVDGSLLICQNSLKEYFRTGSTRS